MWLKDNKHLWLYKVLILRKDKSWLRFGPNLAHVKLELDEFPWLSVGQHRPVTLSLFWDKCFSGKLWRYLGGGAQGRRSWHLQAGTSTGRQRDRHRRCWRPTAGRWTSERLSRGLSDRCTSWILLLFEQRDAESLQRNTERFMKLLEKQLMTRLGTFNICK